MNTPDENGWIDWHGGSAPPVPAETKVQVMYRHGKYDTDTAYSAGDLTWFWYVPGSSYCGGDIIAYKMVQP